MFVLIMMGLISLIGAAIHLMFNPLFNWKDDIGKLKNVNRSAALTMNNLVAYILLFFGITDLLWAFSIVQVQLLFLVGIIGFWVLRTILQLVYFDLKERLSHFFLFVYLFMIIGHVSLFT